MIQNSLVAAGFALTPAIFAESSELTDTVLRPCAAVFLVIWSLTSVEGYRITRSAAATTESRSQDWGLVIPIILVYIPGFTLPVLILSPLFPSHSAVLYTATVFCPLMIALIILRALIREVLLPEPPA